MTHYDILLKHLTRHNATILLKTQRLIMWEYNGCITIDEFTADGSAIGRTVNCPK